MPPPPEKISRAAILGDAEAIREWFRPVMIPGTSVPAPKRDPDAREADGSTLLYHAVSNGHRAVTRLLLDNGAAVDLANNEGNTPLQGAAICGRVATAILLLDRGADIEHRSNVGSTPLVNAAVIGNCDMIRLLLHRGALLEMRSAGGSTAETFARYSKKGADAVSLLAAIRVAGGWRPYANFPRRRLLELRLLCEGGRAHPPPPADVGASAALREAMLRIQASASHAAAISIAREMAPAAPGVLERLFPSRAPAAALGGETEDAAEDAAEPPRAKRRRAPTLPTGIFWLILSYWRTSRDYDPEARPPAAAPPTGGDLASDGDSDSLDGYPDSDSESGSNSDSALDAWLDY